MQENFYRFRSRYIILDIGLIFIGYAILFAIAEVITGVPTTNLIKDPIVEYLFSIFFTITICLAVLRRFKKPKIQLKYLIGDRSIRSLPWLMLSICFYGIYTFCQGISTLTIYFTHLISPSTAKSAIEQLSKDFVYNYNTDSLAVKILFYALLFVALAIVPPLTEEFLFRGVLLHRFAAKWGTTTAILLSSFVFGIAHGNIHALAIGTSFIFVSLLYIKTQTLIVPIAFHVMNNTIAFISGTLESYVNLHRPITIGVDDLWSGILQIAFATPILLYFFKWPKPSELLPYAANIERKYPDRLEIDREQN